MPMVHLKTWILALLLAASFAVPMASANYYDCDEEEYRGEPMETIMDEACGTVYPHTEPAWDIFYEILGCLQGTGPCP